MTALGALRQNKVRSFLTTLGVIIGVMAVVLLVSLGTAARAFIENEFKVMGSHLIVITPGKQETTGMVPMIGGSVNKLTRENVKQIIHRATGILGACPMVIGAGKFRAENRDRDIAVVGTSGDFPNVRQTKADEGRFFTNREMENNTRVCVLGKKLREEMFGDGPALYQRVSLNQTKFLVVGVMEPRGMTLGINLDDQVFVPATCAQQMFFAGEDILFQILALPQSQKDVALAAESIRQILIAAHDDTEDFTVLAGDSALDVLRRIFSALQFMLAGIASISLLVGGIGIMNIMLVSVRERTREVGIRKAVGARRRDIGVQFLIEAVSLSVLGGVLGIVGGWCGTTILRYLYPALPAYLSTWAIVLAFFFSLGVGVFFGVYPAVKASGVDPVEALRYE
jgi:putative ABC transport system permease protein